MPNYNGPAFGAVAARSTTLKNQDGTGLIVGYFPAIFVPGEAAKVDQREVMEYGEAFEFAYEWQRKFK